jgi:amino acid transporter
LAVVGFSTGSPSNFWPPYAAGDNAVAQTVRFVLPGLTFLTGFGLVAILAEDADLAPRQIRRAVMLAVALAASFYIVVLLASAWVIPWEQTAGLEKGTIEAFDTAGFPALGWAAYAVSVMGLLTSFIALFVATSRILVAMGRAGLLPSALGRLEGARRTPRTALVFTLAVALGLGWLGPGALVWFLDTGGVYIGLAWAIGVACLYRLPRRRPDLEPTRSFVVRTLPALGAVAVVAYALWPGTDLSLVWPQEYLILLAWVALGAVMYRLSPPTDDETALRGLLGEHAAAPASGAPER